MTDESQRSAWEPHAGIGGLLLAHGIMISLMSKGILSQEDAHGILDEQVTMLEDWLAHGEFSDAECAHISSGLRDLTFLLRMMQKNPLTRLPE